MLRTHHQRHTTPERSMPIISNSAKGLRRVFFELGDINVDSIEHLRQGGGRGEGKA